MRVATLVICLLVLATSALAEKVPAVYPSNTPLVSERQGGDTVATATPIGILPYNGSGTTLGYADDYDEVCPYTGSTSTDVVYSLVPCEDGLLNISLCIAPTDYDTKLYVYDADLNLVGCNDDFCSVPISFVSELTAAQGEPVPVSAGMLYYIVVDGYAGASGNYGIEITGMECSTATQDETWSSTKSLYR
jgi:hypothetical protein